MVPLFFIRCLFLFLFSAERSAGLPPAHPLRRALDRVNRESGPFVGLVMGYKTESEALQASGDFIPRPDFPYVDLYGRRFHVGKIRGVDVVYVLSGQRRLNAGITVQALLDNFSLRGIVHYGTAGSANGSLSFGDVSVPEFVAFTGSWTWTRFGAKKEDELPELEFGEYNVPSNSDNWLSSVEFKPEEFFEEGKAMKEVFWMRVTPKWYEIAKKLKVELHRCVNETFCLPKAPKLVTGLKASTADIFLDNAAYREFLFNKFGVSTVDEESSAIVMAARSPGVPVIVFRAVSDLAGGEESTSSSLMELASMNSLKVAVEFVGAIGKTEKKKRVSALKGMNAW